MNNNEIRIAIAQSLGWKHVEPYGNEAWGCNAEGKDWKFLHQLPNYPESLDGCREFEEPLNANYEMQTLYVRRLTEVVYRKKHSGCSIEFAMATANALQRCEAYLKMKGLWK